MANPQREKGNIQIATEIWEHLCLMRIPGEARQVLDFILRKTYGWNKKFDKIPLSQFVNATNIDKHHISRNVKLLERMNLIKVTNVGNEIAKTYMFNKDFDSWVRLPKMVTLPKTVTKVTKSGNKKVTNLGTSINTLSINTTIDNKAASQVTRDIQAIFDIFYKSVNPNINFGNKTSRLATEWLLKKYGFEKTASAANYAVSVQSQKFAPTITTPYQLKEKMAALAKFKATHENAGKVTEL